MKRYIAEIAGKDSVAAVMKFIRENGSLSSCNKEKSGGSDLGIVIIPTIVYTGTEYGDKKSYYDSIEFIRKKAEEAGIGFEEGTELQDGRLWNILCAKYQYLINKKYGFYTPCVACHMFTHLMRIPLLRRLGAEAVITGERHSHQGRLKANQHPGTMECFNEIFEKNGINMIKPLLEIEDTGLVNEEIADEAVIEHANDVKCVLSGNLKGFPLEENIDKLMLYLDEFLKPVGNFCVKTMPDFTVGEERMEWYDRLEEKIEEILI